MWLYVITSHFDLYINCLRWLEWCMYSFTTCTHSQHALIHNMYSFTTCAHSQHVLIHTNIFAGIEPGPPALEASTIPLGYWGGGIVMVYIG